jgi:putative oxidoreductase
MANKPSKPAHYLQNLPGMKIPFVIGRLLFGRFFLYGGINHFRWRSAVAQYAEAKKLPMPDLAVMSTGVAPVLGGTSLLLGIKPKLGAAAIIGFLGGVSPIMHDFWSFEDPNQRMNEVVNFSKNMALLGSALALLSVREPWPVSIPLPQPSRFERLLSAVRGSIAAYRN